MDNRVLNQMEGIIGIRLFGTKVEKVINMALARGIYIWEIKRREDFLEFKIRRSAYEALSNIVSENNYKMEIINEKGLPFFKNTIKRRFGFFGGAVLFLLAIYFVSSFIWFIEVVNNEKVDSGTIMMTAARHGLYKGAAKWNFSRTDVEEAMMLDINQLSYIKVDIRGVKATIEVVEKILPGDEITGPCHIVAAKDGVVEEILLLEGQVNVKEGDVVSKGDILISGIVFYQPNPLFSEIEEDAKEDKPVDIVRARGIVRARVWYEGYGECKRTTERIINTGRMNRQIIVKSPWFDFRIYGAADPGYVQAKTQVKKREIESPIGVFGWNDLVSIERKKVVTHLSENEAVKIARQKAMQTLTDAMKQDKLPREMEIEILSAPSDPVLRCKVAVDVIEDIAKPEPINEQ
ncbi:MAG: sporulation protein YqfD [Syntrophomonadaceae bacterium]|jgi:similar to stage IV sporulation protein|nr:sporulation protein YqfD [Syntrophomonadaceae bacterium]